MKEPKTKTQWYLGAPNAVVLCVDRAEPGMGFAGRGYHAYSAEPFRFDEPAQILKAMESLYDAMSFPFPNTTMRTFGAGAASASAGSRAKGTNPAQHRTAGRPAPEERTTIMSDKELLEKHGDLGTFIIRVQQRQNSTWQGRITWMDEDKSVNFRSIWEMVHLIEEAIGPMSDDGKQNW